MKGLTHFQVKNMIGVVYLKFKNTQANKYKNDFVAITFKIKFCMSKKKRLKFLIYTFTIWNNSIHKNKIFLHKKVFDRNYGAIKDCISSMTTLSLKSLYKLCM